MRYAICIGLTIIVLAASGCAGSGANIPLAPADTHPTASPASRVETTAAANRHIWGLWQIDIPADGSSAEVVPMRGAEMHLNAVRMVEVAPCKTCLSVANVHVTGPNELEADLTLVHPYPGELKYTGFDVRGIFISKTDYTFPSSGRKIALGDAVPRLLDPDGYTALFNPTEFPPDQPGPPALRYIPGKFATGGDLSATLNPFLAYRQDAPRRMFESGGSETRTASVYAPPGPIHFGYAVDVCWQDVENVIDPLTDFPPDANCLEAYGVDVQINQGLNSQAGSSAPIAVAAFDRQGLDTISKVTIEAPGLFTGVTELAFSTTTPEGAYLFTGDLTNDLGASYGDYPVLVRIVDTATDQNIGAVDAWQIASAGIKQGWARTWGGHTNNKTSGFDVETDDQGNIYVAGGIVDVADFDPGPGVDEHGTVGTTSVFLSKFDSNGNYLWARTWGTDDWCSNDGLAIDQTGCLYVTGCFRGEADLDPGPDTDSHVSNGDFDAFLSKFDSAGTFIWARTWGAEGTDRGCAVRTDSTGQVYVGGGFESTVDFDPGPGIDERTAKGSRDAFLCKFTDQGEFRWVGTWGGKYSQYGDLVNDIAIDGMDHVYAGGAYSGTADFDPGPGVEEHTSYNSWFDAYLSRFDTEGTFEWVRVWGGPAHQSVDGLDVDTQGNVFVAGIFHFAVDFDPGPGTAEYFGCALGSGYLSKFDSYGEFQWVWPLVSNASTSGECVSVTASNLGTVSVTGDFAGTVDFDPGPDLRTRTAKNLQDVFVTCLDPNGAFLWVDTWGGEEYDGGQAIASDAGGNLFVAGRFRHTVDFDPGPSIEYHTPSGSTDAFLCKLLPDGQW